MERSPADTANDEVPGVGWISRRLREARSRPAEALVTPSTNHDDASPWRWRTTHALVALAVFFNLWSLRGERLSVAYPNDSAMHLQMTTLATELLRRGLSPFDHWYPLLSLGSAFFVQYQSLSAVLTGAVALLFGPAVTFAWSLYLLLSLWPLCVYWSTRLLLWGRAEAATAAVLSPLIFTVTGRGFGHQSYVWIGSGLWSQLWAMWTLPLAWAFTWRYLSQRRFLLPAVVALSLTVAFHFLTGYLCALTLAVWILVRPSQFLARARRALLLGSLTLLATAWVTLPLFLHAKWLAVNQFQVGTTINDSYGARQVLAWLFTGQIYDWRRWPLVSVLVGVGLLRCLRNWRRDERARALVGAWTLSLLLFFGRPTLGFLIDRLPGNQNLLLQRYVMGLHLAGLVLAGVGAMTLVEFLARTWRAPITARDLAAAWRTPLVIAVAILALAPAWTQIVNYDRASASWISYQRAVAPTLGADVASLVALAEARGGGRIYAGMPSNWGHHFYVGAVPVYIYLEQLNVDAVGFTLRTSGLMTDPEAYFDEYVPGDFSALGVRYLLLPVGHAPPVPATLLRTAGPYRLWQVHDPGASSLVQVVDTFGVIAADNATLGTQTSSFLQSALPGRALYPTIAYAGAPGAAPTLSSLTARHGAPGDVIAQRHDLLYAQDARATVIARRRSVVLLKVAFDPGWRVTVDGRRATTIMVAPALLGVQVTPGRHVVVFTYHGFAHYDLLYALAAVTLLATGLAPWWWRRRATGDPNGGHSPPRALATRRE